MIAFFFLYWWLLSTLHSSNKKWKNFMTRCLLFACSLTRMVLNLVSYWRIKLSEGLTVWKWLIQIRPFNGLWSGTTLVGWYQRKHSPTHTHPDHRASFIIFLHLQRSMASSLFNLRAWQSSRTTSFQFSYLYVLLHWCRRGYTWVNFSLLQCTLYQC